MEMLKLGKGEGNAKSLEKLTRREFDKGNVVNVGEFVGIKVSVARLDKLLAAMEMLLSVMMRLTKDWWWDSAGGRKDYVYVCRRSGACICFDTV
jgi:hypothetical protein